jgi:hypothetical protein
MPIEKVGREQLALLKEALQQKLQEIELTQQGRFYEIEVEQGNTEIELYFDECANPITNFNEDA